MAERNILVTGAASGIGAAACRALAGPGVAIAVHTRGNREGSARTAEAVRARGGLAFEIFCDLSEAGAPEHAVQEAAGLLGGLDVVVSNAGFADRTPIAALTDEGFIRSQDAIALAFLRLAREAGPILKQGRDPRLVAVSSFVAHLFRNDVTGFPASAAAKAKRSCSARAVPRAWPTA